MDSEFIVSECVNLLIACHNNNNKNILMKNAGVGDMAKKNHITI